MSVVWSFDIPLLNSIYIFPGPFTTSRGDFIQQKIKVEGSQLMLANPTSNARVQFTSCQASEWLSETSTSCLLPRGIAAYEIFTVTAGMRQGSDFVPFTYYRTLLQIQSEGSQIVPSKTLTIFGIGFGINDYTTRNRLGVTACEFSNWISDSTTCCLIPAGALRPDRVTSTVSGLENFWVPIYVSFLIIKNDEIKFSVYLFSVFRLFIFNLFFQLLVSNSPPGGHYSLTVNGIAFQITDQVFLLLLAK
jgi:hypothetical protein